MKNQNATTLKPPALSAVAAPAPPGYKWVLLGLLWIAFFLHQGDRQIFNSVIPLVKTSLGLSDIQMGLIGSIFQLVYGVLVPLAGLAGDRLPRKWIIVWSLLIFSAGTLLTGFSSGLIALVIFRSLATGGGEAFFILPPPRCWRSFTPGRAPWPSAFFRPPSTSASPSAAWPPVTSAITSAGAGPS